MRPKDVPHHGTVYYTKYQVLSTVAYVHSAKPKPKLDSVLQNLTSTPFSICTRFSNVRLKNVPHRGTVYYTKYQVLSTVAYVH